MRILHAVETLSRNGGGLPIAVTEMAASVAKAEPDWHIDLVSSSDPDPVPVSESLHLTTVGRDRVSGARASRWIAEQQQAASFSVIHQHGLWAPLPVGAGRFAKSRQIPLVLSPHGMLEAWAMAYRKGRKTVAWHLYQKRNLQSAAVLHAASESEGERFRRLGFRQPIAMLPHGVEPIAEAPDDPDAVAAPKERKQLLMLSRIHPKKGLDLLLEAWARLAPEDWQLVIAGNDEGDHQAEIEALAKRLGLTDEARVRFAGPLFDAEKDTAFRRADLFILPSYSENFGIVVPEALQYGLPVVTTADTPWGKLASETCGWWVPPTADAIGGALREAIDIADEERTAMGRRGRDLVDREHRWPRIAEGYVALYRWLADGGQRDQAPDCVRFDEGEGSVGS